MAAGSSGLGLPRPTPRGQRSGRIRGPGPARVPGGAAGRPRPGQAPTAHDADAQARSGACRGIGRAGARTGASAQRARRTGCGAPAARIRRSPGSAGCGRRGRREVGAWRKLQIRLLFCCPEGRANTSPGTRQESPEFRRLPSGPLLLRVPLKIPSGSCEAARLATVLLPRRRPKIEH